MLQIKIDEKECNGCGICVEGCSVPCLSLDEGRGKAIVVNQNGCIVCRQCEVACPLEAITVDFADWPRVPSHGISTIL